MAYKLKTKKAKRCNYGSSRSTSKIKYAVAHYTGNDGDTDEANANYFANNNVGASAHYFIDDDSVTQSVPDNYVAWAVGSSGLLDQGSPYKKNGAKYFGKCTNTNSLSFELCDTKKDGKRMVTKATRGNAVAFIAKKMHQYNIPIGNLIRHFDVNGKLCPLYWVTDEADWKAFKKEVEAELKKLKGEKESAKATTKTLKVGAKIKIKSGAKDLNTNKKYASFVYQTTYEVISIKGTRVVFGQNGAVTGATDKSNVKLV